MVPIAWNDINVPRSAPISETKPPKTRIVLAMMYEIVAMIYEIVAMMSVQPIHMGHCANVMAVRCREPCRRRTKMYLAGS